MSNSWNIDSSHGGEGWVQRPTNHNGDIGTIWTKCGVNSEYGALRKVILHIPGEELTTVTNPKTVDWYALVDKEKAICQMSNLMDVYQNHGVEVALLSPRLNPRPNHLFVRDLFTMTPSGAIVSRMASHARMGEELDMAAALSREKIPILTTIHGEGTFEGPDLLFFKPDRAFVANSVRSNKGGVDQVRALLKLQGIDVVDAQTVYGCGHLDGVISLLRDDLALIHPKRVSYTVCKELIRSGYQVVELPSRDEAENNMAINMVSINRCTALIPKGNPETFALLKRHDIAPIEIDLSEVMKAGGGIHCVTGVVHRDMQ